MTTAAAEVPDPIDDNRYLDPNPTPQHGAGWTSVFGFLDGVRGVTDRVERIADDVGDTHDRFIAAKRNAWELDRDQRDAKTDDFLKKAGFARGDNVKLYWVLGAAGVVVVALIAR